MHNNIKVKIMAYLQDYNFSHQSFAQRARLNRNSLSSIMINRSRNPNIETILKKANAFNCSLDDLVEQKNFLIKNRAIIQNSIKYISF